VLDGIEWLVGQALAARDIFAGLTVPAADPKERPDDKVGTPIGQLVRAAGERPAKARLALAGMMGVGKSTVGRELARRLGCELADTDDLIVERVGRDVRWLFDHRGEEEFRRIEAETIARIIEGDAPLIALGGGSLERQATNSLVRACCRVVWLCAAPGCLAQRLRAQADIRPLLDGADLEPRLASLLAARTRTYAAEADLMVDAERPVEDVVDLIAFEAACIGE
jgi:shikimate kinase